jgi:hypothetical protein
VLLETAAGAVAYERETRDGRIVLLGFQLEDSNLYQFAGFPVFLQNAIQWIGEDLQKKAPSVTNARHRKEGAFEEDGIRGFANFADEEESMIQPVKVSGSGLSAARSLPHRRDVSQWFLILVIAIVMVEWWSFHRRTEI